MNDFKIPTLKCKRCGHEWIPRTTKYPKVCASCNSPYWNKEKGWYSKMRKKKEMSEEEKDWIGEKTEMAYYAPDKRKK